MNNLLGIQNPKCTPESTQNLDRTESTKSSNTNITNVASQITSLQNQINTIPLTTSTNPPTSKIVYINPTSNKEIVYVPGPAGPQGPKGDKGEPGKDGLNSTNGTTTNLQQTWTPSQYQYVPVQGQPGKDGISGKDGSYITLITQDASSTTYYLFNPNTISTSSIVVPNSTSTVSQQTIIDIVASSTNTDNLFTNNATVTNLFTSNANVVNATATNIYTNNIFGTNGTITNLFSNVINSISGFFTNIFVKTITASTTNTNNLNTSNATITNLYASNLATTSYTGNYTDLLNKPTNLSQFTNDSGFITSVTWNNILSKPSFATVATSGSYTDLTNKPTIPAAQVNSDWNAVSGVAQILNKPTLFSGSYTDLSNKPSLFSGSYLDLTNKPTIPTLVSQLTNDSGFITGVNWGSIGGTLASQTDLQTALGLKTNYTDFILSTIAQNDLSTNSTGFSNFNGASSSYDNVNKRLMVTNGATLGKGVWFGTDLVAGHRYTVYVNATVTGTGAIRVGFGGVVESSNFITGDNYVTFVAPTASGYGNKVLLLADGTFYINYISIKEVPLSFDYATKGDILPQIASYQPIINNTSALQYITANTIVKLGQNASAIGSQSISIGQNSISSNTATIAIGASAYATAATSQAYGQFAKAEGPSSIAIGYQSNVTSGETGSVAIGSQAKANVTAGIGVGGGGSVAVGANAIAGSWRATAIGGNAQALAVSATALGFGSYANAPHSQALGRGAYNDLQDATLFFADGGNGEFYFGSVASKFTNPAMPGTESYDLSSTLNAGTQKPSILRGIPGRDTSTTSTLFSTRGGAMRLAGGQSTGLAAGGDVQLSITPATSVSNNTVNPDDVVFVLSGANQNIAIGDNTPVPDNSAKLDIQSTSAGFLAPRMTTTQWNNISNKAKGLQGFDITLNKPVWYDGTTSKYPLFTTDTISISQLPQASSTGDGFLSSADWNTFNNKSNFDGAFSSLTGRPNTLSGYNITDGQSTLVSGTNIKTINGNSVLGSGDLSISGSLWTASSSNIYYTSGNVGIGTTTPSTNLTIVGTTTVEGNIVPSKDKTYSLGTIDNAWGDLYVGPHSIYLNGKKVLEDVSNTITFSTDADQNLSSETTGIGNNTLRAKDDGNVSVLANSGNVNIQSVSGILNIGTTGSGYINLGTIHQGVWNGTAITDAFITSASTWNAKQDGLVSGTNIKTVGGASLLGSGDITLPTKVSDLTNDSGFLNNITGLIATGTNVSISGNGTSGSPYMISATVSGGIGGSLSAGQIAFGTATDTIGGDNGLFWDNTNKRLGIGKTNPSATLDVNGNATFVIGTFNTTPLKIVTQTGAPVLAFYNGNTDSTPVPTIVGYNTFVNIYNGFTFRRSVGTGVIASFADQSNITRATINTNGTSYFGGPMTIGAYTLPNIDGTSGQVLTTNGSGVVSWGSTIGGSIAAGQVPFGTATGTVGGSANLTWDSTNSRLGIGTSTPGASLEILGGSSIPGFKVSNNPSGAVGGTETFLAQNTNSAGQATFIFKNDVSGYNSYAGMLYGGSTISTSGLFGSADRKNKLFLFADGSSNQGMYIGTLPARPLILGTNNTERLRIDQSGNVGIGTSSPSYKLDVSGTGRFTGALTIGAYTLPNTNGTSGQVLTTNGSGVVSWGNQLWTASSSSIYYTSGSVGIGTIPTNYTLEVGNSSTTGVVASFTNNSGSCTINPNTTSLSCSSDIRLKTNIHSLFNINNLTDDTFNLNTNIATSGKSILDKILDLTAVTYNWKTEATNTPTHTGFIAQEVEQLFPDLVSINESTGYKGVNYIGITPYLVSAIQEETSILNGNSAFIKNITDNATQTINSLIANHDNFDPVNTIWNRLNSGYQLITDFVALKVSAIKGYFNEIFVKKIHVEELCIKKSNGTEFCANGDQIENAVNNQNAVSNSSNSGNNNTASTTQNSTSSLESGGGTSNTSTSTDSSIEATTTKSQNTANPSTSNSTSSQEVSSGSNQNGSLEQPATSTVETENATSTSGSGA